MNLNQKKELSIIDNNIKILENANKKNHSLGEINNNDGLEKLIDNFKEEKQQYLHSISKNQKKDNYKNKEDSTKKVEESSVANDFSNFSTKAKLVHQKDNNDNIIESDDTFTISLLSKKSSKKPLKCEASYYGLGLIINQFNMIESISEYSLIANKLNIKIGDYLMGIKNEDNSFFIGNSLINLIQKKYNNEVLTIILKQNGKIVQRMTTLDTICYTKNKK